MASLITSIAVLLVVIYCDIRPKWGKGKRKELWICGVFLLFGFIILALGSMHIYLPSPLAPIESVISAFFGE